MGDAEAREEEGAVEGGKKEVPECSGAKGQGIRFCPEGGFGSHRTFLHRGVTWSAPQGFI